MDGTLEVQFAPASDAASRYGHIARVVRRFGYAHLPRADKQVVLRYLGPTSGYSPAQVKRLVARALAGEPLARRYRAPPQAYARRYTEADVRLLAAVDTAFGTLSGPATVLVLRRTLDRYDDRRFERLARLSVSHLYNLRASGTYERQRVLRTATRASTNPIGTSRAPDAGHRPARLLARHAVLDRGQPAAAHDPRGAADRVQDAGGAYLRVGAGRPMAAGHDGGGGRATRRWGALGLAGAAGAGDDCRLRAGNGRDPYAGSRNLIKAAKKSVNLG